MSWNLFLIFLNAWTVHAQYVNNAYTIYKQWILSLKVNNYGLKKKKKKKKRKCTLENANAKSKPTPSHGCKVWCKFLTSTNNMFGLIAKGSRSLWFLLSRDSCSPNCNKIIFKCVNSTVGPIFNIFKYVNSAYTIYKQWILSLKVNKYGLKKKTHFRKRRCRIQTGT